jgi:hypothetical protein
MTFRPDKRTLGSPLPYIPVGVFRHFSRLLFAIGLTPPVRLTHWPLPNSKYDHGLAATSHNQVTPLIFRIVAVAGVRVARST